MKVGVHTYKCGEYVMPVPWRIVGRATPFSNWMFLGYGTELQRTCARAEHLKRQHRYYVVRVLAN